MCLLGFSSTALQSCSDDIGYTTSSSALLTFSTDTLSLDTVFSTIPSSSKDFWIYNRGSSHIRLAEIRQSNPSSGFRVNVDGIYLGEGNDYKTDEIEVRSGDSIRVFVELTSEESGEYEPQRIDDSLIFTTEGGAVQELPLNAWTWDATIYDNKTIRLVMSMSNKRPIVVYGPLIVEYGAVLTIPAGTTLYFHDDAYLDVYGSLVARL